MNADPSAEDLVALNRLATIARVLAGTAHDVNNALQIISGSAEMLAAAPDLPEGARRAVARIEAQSARAATAMHAVMQFARERGDAVVRLSLRDVVSQAVTLRQFQLRRAGIALDYDAAALPPADVPARPGPVLQAVLNLIMNAEQAVQGRADGRIRVEVVAGPDAAEVIVSDNGGGIDPAMQSRLFEPFATTRPGADTVGLGLTAARLIARAHGGDVTVAAAGPGCRVTFQVPLPI